MRTGTAFAARRYQPGPARRRRGCRHTASRVDWRTTVQIG
jgi:hypothetical protein